VCFIEQTWPGAEDRIPTFPGAEDVLSMTRRLLDLCGMDSVRMNQFLTDDGFEAGEEPISILRLALHNFGILWDPWWDPLAATKLLINTAIQEGTDFEQRDLFGLTPVVSVTRNTEPRFWVSIVEKLLEAGASPLQVDNDGCGILHHIIRQLSACNDHEMSEDIAEGLVNLITNLITRYSCDPLLSDLAGETPFDEALAPVAWGLWCRALVLANRNIEEDLIAQDARSRAWHSESYLQSKYHRALKLIHRDAGSFFYEQEDSETSLRCPNCGKSNVWQLRREPFNCFGSYLTKINAEFVQHTYAYNHRDGSYCNNIRNPNTCKVKQHGGNKTYCKRSLSELSWRKHVAYRLWRDGLLPNPSQAQLVVSGFAEG
jgi:hypothetical protein